MSPESKSPESNQRMQHREGIIKFKCRWIHAKEPDLSEVEALSLWRDRLHELGLIGVYPDGVGFGNLSIRRTSSGEFIISGSQTGHLAKLDGCHWTRVVDFNLAQNSLTCKGPVKASSESLTHAAFYSACPSAGAVIHVHSKPMWLQLGGQVPTSSKAVEYGTPQMALEVKRLLGETDLLQKKIMVMGGHEEGIVVFGKDLEEAGQTLLSYQNKII